MLDPFSKKIALGFEMISNQKDDKIVKDIYSSLSIIKGIIDSENYSVSTALGKNRTVANELRVIEKLVKDRFGFRIKILPDDTNNFGVVPVTPLNYNVLTSSGESNYKNMKAMLDLYGKDDNVDPDKISTMYGNETKVFSLITDAFDGLESSLNLKGLKIDLNKAYISGLPKEYIVFMMADFCYMLNTLKLTIEELTAVVFHELGHVFTHLEYSSRTYSSTMVLIDTIQADMARGNNTLRKTLVLAYEHAFKTKMTSAESATEVTAMITIANRYIDNSRVLNHSNISYTDSEQLADQFAGKFGLSADLATALAKFQDNAKSPVRAMLEVSFSVFLIYSVFGFLFSLSLVSGMMIGLVMGFGVAVLMTILAFIDSVITSGGTSRQNTYDDIKRRLERITNEAIRTLRMSDYDIDNKKGLIKNCEALIRILDDYPEDEVSVFDKFIRWINRGGSSAHLDARQFEELVEDLQSNRIYLAAAKFKTLK